MRPVAKGSSGLIMIVDVPLTQADPVMDGVILFWLVIVLKVPVKVVFRMPACIQVCPGDNLPSAWRQAILADVPVPHGERSYSAPGQRTKFLLSECWSVGGLKTSTWSTGCPSSPCMLADSRVFLTAVVNSVSCLMLFWFTAGVFLLLSMR